MVREDNEKAGKTWYWNYWTDGSLRDVNEFDYTLGAPVDATSTISCTYALSTWHNLMTKYGSTAFTYDEIGNTLTDGTWTYTWERGRQLKSMTNGTTTWNMTYDADGLRTSRIATDSEGNTGNKYYYYYEGGLLTYMKFNTLVMRFTYDAQGNPVSMTYNGNIYFYVLNLQGDVMALLDSSGNEVVSYHYNAWGKLIDTTASTTGMLYSLALYNPLRYRGYVYDRETGLYYLQSRYYNPEICRFINADNVSNLGADGSVLSYNLYAYCCNNPIMGSDPTGNWNWKKFFSGASLLATGLIAVATAATIITCGAAAPLMVAVATTTAAAGTLTAINGAAEVVEAATDYNVVRDGLMGGDTEAYESYRDITSTIAQIGTSICGSYYAAKGGNVCFIAGTLVKTPNGNVPIESIAAGEMVLAWDEVSGDIAPKEVVETYINKTSELVHVYVNGQEIVTTPSHPFYSPVKGWTDAVHLRAGDILVLVNGEYAVVEKIQHEILESPITVYNFQVADYHTYYVADAGVLVHNSCNHGKEWARERRSYWRGQAKTAVHGQDYGAYVATDNNIGRMRRGAAPIGWDGKSVELHHWSGIVNDFKNYSPVSRTLHQLIHSIR